VLCCTVLYLCVAHVCAGFCRFVHVCAGLREALRDRSFLCEGLREGLRVHNR
jgi:hypothetical protein